MMPESSESKRGADGPSELRQQLRASVPKLRAERERLQREMEKEESPERRLWLESELSRVEAELQGIGHIIGPEDEPQQDPPSSPDD